MLPPTELVTNRLSHYRTSHRFRRFAEFTSVEEFVELQRWAQQHGFRILILGNGSNVLFSRRTVRTLVLKNRLARSVTPLPDDRLEVTSSVPVSVVLKYCEQRRLESFYYLSSVPATIGGAIAMNAGRGRTHAQSIFDFVSSITVACDGQTDELARADIPVDYRSTPFTGLHQKLVVSVVFHFPPLPADAPADAIEKRIEFSKTHQDLEAPNCGSVFKDSDSRIMNRIKGLRFFGAEFSRKTPNWLRNRARSSLPLRCLILAARVLHRLCGRRAALELIVVK